MNNEKIKGETQDGNDSGASDCYLSEIRRQLKLPIGYQGRSYDDAVRDFDNLLRDVESHIMELRNALITIRDNRNQFEGPSLDYMQGYRDGQEFLSKIASGVLDSSVESATNTGGMASSIAAQIEV